MKKKLFDIFKDFDEELPPCKFCGRVMLAGWCCTKALEEAKKPKKIRRVAHGVKGTKPTQE